MKYLIVNGDDFGASSRINRAIIDAHGGILTSASLLVNAQRSREAAALSGQVPRLSVGLHVDLPGEIPSDIDECRARLREQFDRFHALMGRAPTHLDSHHNVHRDARWVPHFWEVALEHNLSLREYSPIRCVAKFYEQWGGQSHLEQISPAKLARMLAEELEDGITELSCHPGYADPACATSCAAEREVELQALYDPAIRQFLSDQSIQLINHSEAASLVGARRHSRSLQM